MTDVLLTCSPYYRGVISITPSGKQYYCQPGTTVLADQNDVNVLFSFGYTLAPISPLQQTGKSLWLYRADTHDQAGTPSSGFVYWNNATQTSATVIAISHITDDGVDVDPFLALIATGNDLLIQDRNNSLNYQTWAVASSITIHTNSYVEVPVTLVNSAGDGTTGFRYNEAIFVGLFG